MTRPSIVAEINAFNTHSPTDIVQEYGGSIGRAAAAIAGAKYEKGVSKNKEYKAARRALERQLTGQHKKPSKGFQEKLNKAGREAQGDKAIGITYAGNFKIGGSDRDVDREREINRTYDAAMWDEMSRLAEQGDEKGLWDLIAAEYHVTEMELVNGEIEIGEE